MASAYQPHLDIDRSTRGYRFYRNAVERHWDPAGIELTVDRERLLENESVHLDELKQTLALFGAGEQAVAEDLAPLGVVIDEPTDQLFIASQLYDEAKHADFFDRYWREVINPVEDDRGEARTSPSDERWFPDDYVELFDRNERAMQRLLDDDTPETRAAAYCHYHLVIEGILAQTGYYGVQRSFSGDVEELPRLPGLVEGFTRIRGDEGRHVGFGMAKLRALVQSGDIEPEYVNELVGELVGLTQGILVDTSEEEAPGVSESELVEYATDRHTQRMQQIVSASADIPDVDDLVKLR